MIDRRNFIVASVAATTTCILSSYLQSADAVGSPTLSSPLRPKRLKPGSVVGIISPASATFLKEDLDIVRDVVKALGLVPRIAPHVMKRYGYFAGTDRQRASDINDFFRDRTIAAILPIRGGWGCSRLLPYLDYELIRKNPKILLGFSDLTALILAINAKTNLVTFHGPNGLTSWNSTQTEYFRRLIFKGEDLTFANLKSGADSDRLMQVKYRIQTITPGKAKGKLFGGNLSVLSTLVGSPYLPDFKGAILFLEDVQENIYRIDRMMTHLKLAGVFEQLAGFIFGQCSSCNPGEGYGSLTLEEVIQDHIKPLKIPAWFGASIGHIETILTLPIGLEVEIDANAGTIGMLQPAVV